APFIEAWQKGPHLVVVRDYAPIPDGRGGGKFRSKVGTILPLAQAGVDYWEASVATSAGEGRAQAVPVRFPRDVAAPFPLPFDAEQIALIGDQLLGQTYGWGESYDLRDCSATLRDFFLPFGIWLPRTSADQIASVSRRYHLAKMTPRRKEELIKKEGRPFLTLLYKPGHIMLYVGEDDEGRPLVFHNAWSIRVRGKDGTSRRQIIGFAALTTLEPGRELGLVPGSSLLELSTELSVIPDR